MMSEVMAIPATVPPLVHTVKDWLGADPDGVEQLYGQVRWTWKISTETFESKFHAKWAEHEQTMKAAPDWLRSWHCISVIWPSQETHIINVILRDPGIDIWCLPRDVRENTDSWNRAFCKGCRMAHDVCKCSK